MNSMYDLCPCNSGKKFKFCCYKVIKTGNNVEIAKLSVKWPVSLCLVGEDWQELGITNLLVARAMPNGNFVIGTYLVDIWCLGVKDTDLQINISLQRLQFLCDSFGQAGKMIEISYEDARSFILGGIKYAANLDFSPHPDWEHSKYIVEPDCPFEDKIQFGRDGKPFYVPGPYD